MTAKVGPIMIFQAKTVNLIRMVEIIKPPCSLPLEPTHKALTPLIKSPKTAIPQNLYLKSQQASSSD